MHPPVGVGADSKLLPIANEKSQTTNPIEERSAPLHPPTVGLPLSACVLGPTDYILQIEPLD